MPIPLLPCLYRKLAGKITGFTLNYCSLTMCNKYNQATRKRIDKPKSSVVMSTAIPMMLYNPFFYLILYFVSKIDESVIYMKKK